MSDKPIQAKLRKCLKTLFFAWSLMVFAAGWATLRAQYCAFPAFLDYVQKDYIDKRTYWFRGASPPGITPATPSEPNVNMLKFETEHRMSTLAKEVDADSHLAPLSY